MSALAAALAMPRTMARGSDKELGAALAGRSLAEIEELAIRAAFARHNGRRLRIMRELGIGKTTLLRKLDELNLRSRRVWTPYR